MFKTQKELWDIIFKKDEEINRLKREKAELSVIAAYKLETDDLGLAPCVNAACVACVYSHLFSLGNGSYIRKCLKSVDCPNFSPRTGQ